jgi:hypothetical protein
VSLRAAVVILIIARANKGDSIIYSYFEIAAKEGDMAGLKGMVMGG